MLHDLLSSLSNLMLGCTGVDLGECARIAHPFPPTSQDDLRLSNTTGILQEEPMLFIDVEVKLACTQMLFYFSFLSF